MSHQTVDAAAGWHWLVRGWYLFTRNPGLWIALALVFGLVLVVLNFVPLIGPLVAALLGPALTGGLVYGARELDAGRTLEFGHLVQAFREPGRAGPMLLLGLVPLVAGIVSAVVTALLVGGAMGAGADGMGGAAILAFAVSLAVGVITGALLLFAIPRVMLGWAAPIDAMTQSVVAVRDNIGAFLLFAVIYFVLSLIAAIPFALGFLVLLPVIAGGIHAAHCQVFGDDLGASDS